MNSITITIPYDAAVELMLALEAMRDTGNNDFDFRMDLIYKKLQAKV